MTEVWRERPLVDVGPRDWLVEWRYEDERTWHLASATPNRETAEWMTKTLARRFATHRPAWEPRREWRVWFAGPAFTREQRSEAGRLSDVLARAHKEHR